jgi:hypothetical protein
LLRVAGDLAAQSPRISASRARAHLARGTDTTYLLCVPAIEKSRVTFVVSAA